MADDSRVFEPTPEWLARLRADKEWAEGVLVDAGYDFYRLEGGLVYLRGAALRGSK